MNTSQNNRQNKNNMRPSRPLTKEEAIRAERIRTEQRRRKAETKMFLEKAFACAVFSLIGVVICLTIIFSYIFIDFNKSEKFPDEPVKITFEKNNTVVLDKEHFSYKNGEYYVSLAKLSEICSFTLHGNSKSMTLTIGEGQYARFDTGTPNVKIGSVYSVLKNPSYFSGGHLFIPTSFFTEMCLNVKGEFDKLGKVRGYNLIFDKDFSLKVLTNTESDSILYEKKDSESDGAAIKFKADLSDYEPYMNPEDDASFLILVNSANRLTKDFLPDDLIDITDVRSNLSGEKMRLYAAKALEAMFIEMRANGFYDLEVLSGFRSYEYQEELLENEIEAFLTQCGGDQKLAKELALNHVSPLGQNEHQTGLCVDMSTSTVLSESLAETQVYKWVYSNCANFGFILRYPKDKTEITGTPFKPWHFRYVGRKHAKNIMDSGLCLEQYVLNQ